MQNRKLVLLTPALGPGGLQRVISVLANYFAEIGNVEVHIVLYGISKQQFYPLNEKVQVHKPDFDFNNNKRVFYTLKTLLFLRSKIKALKPDAVLSYGEYWNNFVLLSLLGLKFPVYVSDRCQPDKSLGRLHNLLRRILYPGAAGIISQTKIARDIYAKMIRHSNIEVIGNPIQQLQLSGVERENIVLSVGRLIPSKHHDMLIDIFLNCYKPGWKLVIAGGDVAYGNVYHQLKEKIITANAENKVELAGNIGDIEEYYLKSKIFAFTSSSEGFPNVVGEALSAGLPVVSFDCVAGPSEMIIDGENGYLVPVFDDKLFGQRLQLLMDNEDLRSAMSVKAGKSVDRFSVETIGKQYLEFLLNSRELQI